MGAEAPQQKKRKEKKTRDPRATSGPSTSEHAKNKEALKSTRLCKDRDKTLRADQTQEHITVRHLIDFIYGNVTYSKMCRLVSVSQRDFLQQRTVIVTGL